MIDAKEFIVLEHDTVWQGRVRIPKAKTIISGFGLLYTEEQYVSDLCTMLGAEGAGIHDSDGFFARGTVWIAHDARSRGLGQGCAVLTLSEDNCREVVRQLNDYIRMNPS